MALVFMVGSANARDNGTGDPLGLIASAAIQPFFAAGPDNTLIEVDSPLNDNDLHVVYFNSFCNRLISLPKFVSRKGVIVFSTDDDLANFPGPPPGPVQGLAVIGRSQNFGSIGPIPASAAIHVRGYWLNLLQDFVRAVDPIAVDSAETGVTVAADKQTYSPLRSAASFVAPQDRAPFLTTIHVVCPARTIYDEISFAPAGFPTWTPGVQSGQVLLGFVYDDEENFILDFFINCTCNNMFQLATISGVFSDAPRGNPTYTELVTYNQVGQAVPVCPSANPACNPPVFTGYRAVAVIGVLDSFGRLNNGAAYNYRNGGDHFLGLFPPFFTPGLR
jgi:hypothetical protein